MQEKASLTDEAAFLFALMTGIIGGFSSLPLQLPFSRVPEKNTIPATTAQVPDSKRFSRQNSA